MMTSYFTEEISEQIRRQIAIREDMELETPSDEKLGICSGCSCPLKLKVWTEMTHIQNHMTPETKAQLDPRCWITK